MHNGKYLCYLKWVASGLNILLLQEDKFVRSQPLVNPALKKKFNTLFRPLWAHGYGWTRTDRQTQRNREKVLNL